MIQSALTSSSWFLDRISTELYAIDFTYNSKLYQFKSHLLVSLHFTYNQKGNIDKTLLWQTSVFSGFLLYIFNQINTCIWISSCSKTKVEYTVCNILPVNKLEHLVKHSNALKTIKHYSEIASLLSLRRFCEVA